MKRAKDSLRNIPGVGEKTEQDLISLGYPTVESLRGQDPEKIYRKECAAKGCKVDRCQLYVYRLAVYFAENEKHDPALLRWWNWKDI